MDFDFGCASLGRDAKIRKFPQGQQINLGEICTSALLPFFGRASL